MSNATDMLDREIVEGDFVVFYSAIYRVLKVSEGGRNGKGMVRIILANPSHSTKPVVKHSNEMFKINAEDVTLWLLKKKQST